MSRKGRSPNKREKTIEVDLLSLISVALIVLMGVLCFFSLLDIVKSFLTVSYFEVSGGERFEPSEIAAFAELRRGERLYGIDTDEAEEKILESCAYIENVKVKQRFPNKVRFVVTEREPIWYIEISGDCYVLDEELRVLEETDNKERLAEEGVIALTMPNIKSAIVGEFLVYGDGKEETDNTESIMELLLASSLNITSADLDNRYDIHLEINGTFTANIGGYSRLETKLAYLVGALDEAYADGAVGGTVDISDTGDRVSIRPIYKDTPTEENENETVG